MGTAGRWPVLAAVHLAVLVLASLLVWWWGQPVEPSPVTLSLSWPFTVAVTFTFGAASGALEGILLRSPRRPVAGYAAMIACSVAALWLPLVMVTRGPGVVPVETSDVVEAEIFWGLFWFAMTVTALAVSRRHRSPTVPQVPVE